MPTAASLEPDGRFFALFVSQSGEGKTSAACSFQQDPDAYKMLPAAEPVIEVLDFDGRIRGLLGSSWVKRDRIFYHSFPPKAKAGDPTYIKVNNVLETIYQQCQVGKSNIETLILDSLTSQTWAMLCDAIPLTHSGQGNASKGKNLGPLQMAGPEDYGFEAQATNNIMTFLRSLPIKNVIVTAHLVDTFGKEDPDDRYSPNVKIGEKLSIRDKLGANVMIYFDHVFKFRKSEGNRHYVSFKSGIARTSYPNLPNGEVDITGQSFYKLFMKLVKGEKP